jgi:hypothetical protein
MELDKVIKLVQNMTDKATNQITIVSIIDRMLITRLERFVKDGEITIEELNKRLLE